MVRVFKKKILAGNEPSDFIRIAQLERLLQFANSNRASNGLMLMVTPGSGVSELLRQAYDRLFTEQKEIIPVYFSIRPSDKTAQNTALRFLGEFLLQNTAFRRRDPSIIEASPNISEIAELAVSSDGYLIDRLAETYNQQEKTRADRAFVRNCLSAPMRAAANGSRVFVMIDDLHNTAGLAGGGDFLDDIREIFGRASIPFAFAGHRRFLFAKMPSETMAVERFSFADAGKLIENLSAKLRIGINDQTRDLIAVQFGGNAAHISSFFASAAAKGDALNTFEQVEKIYTDEVFGGRVGLYFDDLFQRMLPDSGLQTRFVKLLQENITVIGGKLPVAYWKKHLGPAVPEFDEVLDFFHYNEIINLSSGSVEIDTGNIVLCDYISGRSRIEIGSEPRALTVGESLSDNVKRAPKLMARFYRRSSAIGLGNLLAAFDGRQVSAALIDYGKFKDAYKGVEDKNILKAAAHDKSTIDLPQIVYTAQSSAFYPRLTELCDNERSAVGLGFKDSSGKDETAWIAVEIDSKLEATRELTDFWCDRLEMLALNCNFTDYKLWIVAPEGFAPDAVETLIERNAFGSSRKQIDLLAGILNVDAQPETHKAKNEYEIVIPMGEDTEMLAASTVEEIAKRHKFPTKSINQIKTALVEACINATEHSKSPDRRIYQKFAFDPDKVTITVANRGLRLSDKELHEITPANGRRGWGLRLIRGLMDDVKVEQSDDGTRITMVKFRSAENATTQITP